MDGVPLTPIAPRPSPFHGLSVQTQPRPGARYPSTLPMGASGAEEQQESNYIAYNTTHQTHALSGALPNLYETGNGQCETANASLFFQHPNGSTTNEGAFAMSSDGQTSSSSMVPSMQYPTPLTGSTTDGTFPPTNWAAQSQSLAANGSFPYGERNYDPHPVDDFLSQHVQEQNRLYGLSASDPACLVEPEDDWFDADSEEDNAGLTRQYGEPHPSNLGLMMKLSAHQNNPNVRSITNFLDGPNMLATYTPIYSASPLMDPQTARVFCHFIAATGPTLNVFERHPSNPSVIFTGRPAPQSQRSLWSYTMPMLALTNQGLLQAMLALSSLHIAKIQRTSPTPSLKHYHYALRRVARALGRPDRRRDVATLAATLLLGFYEVTTAEHNKWNSHLSGARELIMEIDFANTARRIGRQCMQQRDEEAKYRQQDATGLAALFPRTSPPSTGWKLSQKLDSNFIGTISGWRIQYDEYGPVVDGKTGEASESEPLRPSAIEEFEIKSDLFWWYAKQDVYQSILSGNRLLYVDAASGSFISQWLTSLADFLTNDGVNARHDRPWGGKMQHTEASIICCCSWLVLLITLPKTCPASEEPLTPQKSDSRLRMQPPAHFLDSTLMGHRQCMA